MDKDINSAAMQVALFCRLNMNRKTNIPIRYSEMGVLIYIAVSQQPVCPAMISSFLGITKPCATAALKILTKSEYIERIPSQSDGRSYTLSITPYGRKLVEEACTEYTKAIELVHQQLGDENFAQFISLLGQANHILKNNQQP
jgi:DNA-binding MarR family transcriptional regulator